MSYIDEAIQTKSDQFHGELVPLSYLQAVAAGIISRIDELDKIKKALFYGKPIEGFLRASLSVSASCEMLPSSVYRNLPIAVDLIHGIIGKVTEAGEQLEALVKTIDSPFEYIDEVNLLEEVGDGQWYDAIICNALGANFDQVQATNIAKLRGRFPNKFTEFDANNRDLGAERKILESDNTDQLLAQYTVETINDHDGFRFRLVHAESGRVTHWAKYESVVLLDHVAAVSQYYYVHESGDIEPMHALEVMALIANGEQKQTEQIFDPNS